jgi:AcrR family transcriptional regulator
LRHRVQRPIKTGTGLQTGLARRGRRLPEKETERLTLQAAVALVRRTGLTVSLDHISLEEVIRAANVPRSSVYRRWPYKDLFISDLVKELARAAMPTAAQNEAVVALIRRLVSDHGDLFASPDGRRSLAAEVIRQAALADFDTLHRSPEWRTYLALQATVMSLAGGELRSQIIAILVESQRDHIARVAVAWEAMTRLLGYRLRPELGATFETLASLLTAGIRGLTLMAISMPDLAAERVHGRPPGASEEAEWSLPALEIASVAAALLEEDPDAEWDAARIDAVREAVESLHA